MRLTSQFPFTFIRRLCTSVFTVLATQGSQVKILTQPQVGEPSLFLPSFHYHSYSSLPLFHSSFLPTFFPSFLSSILPSSAYFYLCVLTTNILPFNLCPRLIAPLIHTTLSAHVYRDFFSSYLHLYLQLCSDKAVSGAAEGCGRSGYRCYESSHVDLSRYECHIISNHIIS